MDIQLGYGASEDVASERHPPVYVDELNPGDWQLWCSDCGFTMGKNTAAGPLCPQCGERMKVMSKKGKGF